MWSPEPEAPLQPHCQLKSLASPSGDWFHASRFRPPRSRGHLAPLDGSAAKHALKVFWFATGSDDRLLPTTKATVDLFKTHGFAPVFKESAGGHTWLNWRDYLNEFAPQLFQ